jgi:hypothetical protein
MASPYAPAMPGRPRRRRALPLPLHGSVGSRVGAFRPVSHRELGCRTSIAVRSGAS